MAAGVGLALLLAVPGRAAGTEIPWPWSPNTEPLEPARAAPPPEATPSRAAVEELDRLIAAGQVDEAAAKVRDALARFPDHPDLLIRAGHIYTAKRRFFIAEDYWAQLARMFPSNAWAQACWGGVLVRLERWDQAEAVLTNALQMDPDELVARFNLACVQVAMSRTGGAPTVEILTAAEMGRASAWARDEADVLPRILGERGYAELCRAVLNGTPVRPCEPGPCTEGGDADLAVSTRLQLDGVARALWSAFDAGTRRDWTNALAGLSRAEGLGAKAPTVYGEIALCKLHLGREREALEEAGRLVTDHPDQPFLRGLRGQILLEAGKAAEAVQDLRLAQESPRFRVENALTLAAALAADGHMEEAKSLVASVAGRSPGPARTYLSEDRPSFMPLKSDPFVTSFINTGVPPTR